MKYIIQYTNTSVAKKPDLPNEGEVIELKTLEELHAFIKKTECGVEIYIPTGGDLLYSERIGGDADAFLEIVNGYRE
jgi:hypothetical protein